MESSTSLLRRIALVVAVAVTGCAAPEKKEEGYRFFSSSGASGDEISYKRISENRMPDPQIMPVWFNRTDPPRVQIVQDIGSRVSFSGKIFIEADILNSPVALERRIKILDRSARYYVVTMSAPEFYDWDDLSKSWNEVVLPALVKDGLSMKKFLLAGFEPGEVKPTIIIEAFN